jgi:hypothetical protein
MSAAVKRLNREPEIEPDALPCPFCGAPAQIQYWHGGKPTKRLLSCSGQADTLMRDSRPITCHASPGVTGENRAEALRRWNTRKEPRS